MGIMGAALDVLTGRRVYEAAIQASYVVDPSTLPISSPWSTTELPQVVADDIFGVNAPTSSRAAAMRIPTVKRARNLIVNSICNMPLFTLRRGQQLPAVEDVAGWEQIWAQTPAWMYRCVDGSTPQERMAWTIDDLIFYEWSVWWRRNGSDGFPVSAGRVNQADWIINADNVVEINGEPQPHNQVIVFRALGNGGLLIDGRDLLDDARTLSRNVKERLANPVPVTELHQTKGQPLTKEQRKDLIDSWIAGRRRGDGIGFSTEEIEVKTHGADADATLMVEARNALSVDLARMIGVSAGMVDATTPKASLNYETKQGRNEEFVDRDLAQYMIPILARLSNDDVVPQGTRTVFDLRDWIAPVHSATGPNLQD